MTKERRGNGKEWQGGGKIRVRNGEKRQGRLLTRGRSSKAKGRKVSGKKRKGPEGKSQRREEISKRISKEE